MSFIQLFCKYEEVIKNDNFWRNFFARKTDKNQWSTHLKTPSAKKKSFDHRHISVIIPICSTDCLRESIPKTEYPAKNEKNNNTNGYLY